MYAGHFSAGLAIKAAHPRLPTWVVLLGVTFLDLLFGVFLLAGMEHARVTPGQPPGFALDFIDWSHSLAAAVFWSAIFALAFARLGRTAAIWAGLAVFSHFVLDFLMHPGDLALWPHSEGHVGLGLWRVWPVGWWFFELGFIALTSAYYVVRARRVGGFGGRALAAVAVVVVLHVVNSPWLSPTG